MINGQRIQKKTARRYQKNGVKLLDDKLEEEKRKGLSEEREKTWSKDFGATNILTLNSILSFSTIMQELGCERISQHERA